MSTKLSGPMLPPASGGPPRRLVVLLHGYGADGNDLIGLGRYWAELLPDALFVAPDAPERCAGSPFGYQWFPLDSGAQGMRLAGAQAAAPVLAQFLADLWTQTGLSAADTYLIGFSQGAMMALHAGTGMPEALRGIVAFSGAFLPPTGYDAQDRPRPSVALLHGEVDTVVEADLSRTADAQLRAAGYPVSLHISRGVGHSIAPDALDFASAFIARQEA